MSTKNIDKITKQEIEHFKALKDALKEFFVFTDKAYAIKTYPEYFL